MDESTLTVVGILIAILFVAVLIMWEPTNRAPDDLPTAPPPPPRDPENK